MSDNLQTSARLVHIYRYPVKGLSPEKLPLARLEKDRTLPFDRAFAIENGKGKFDPEQPKYLPKVNFLMLMRHEKLARLKTLFDDASQQLTIVLQGKTVASGALDTPHGRATIEHFMAGYMSDELKGAPKIVHSAGHSFSDVSAKCLHIINLNSVRELEKLMGQSIDPLRFRANLVIDGPPAFGELEWVGRSLGGEDVSLKIFKRTQRCPATNVDPSNGVRDMTIPDLLFEHFGHRDFGVYARVETGGVLATETEMRLS